MPKVPALPRRLVLWDVDGTLLSGGPMSREVFDLAVASVTGAHPGDHGVHMSGKTDPQIALEIMTAGGTPEADAVLALPVVLDALQRGLAGGAARSRAEGRVHAGVEAVLERLHRDAGVIQSVLTGNLEANARVKVGAFGLDRYLDMEVGAYGSDHPDREELIHVAVRRVRERRGASLDPADVWVVGDTPRDLATARAGGARCLLVGTGRFRFEELEPLGADAVVPDLSDTAAVVRLLVG